MHQGRRSGHFCARYKYRCAKGLTGFTGVRENAQTALVPSVVGVVSLGLIAYFTGRGLCGWLGLDAALQLDGRIGD